MLICPHCGFERQIGPTERRAKFFSFVVGIIAIAVVGYISTRVRRTEPIENTKAPAAEVSVTPRARKKPTPTPPTPPPKDAVPREP